MKRKISDDEMTRLLLGQVSEDERDEIEQELLTSQESFEAFLALDEELMDEYVAGGLSPIAREAFERRILSSPRAADRLKFARVLASLEPQPEARDSKSGGAVSPPSRRAVPLRRFPALGLLVAACLALVVVGVGFLIRTRFLSGGDSIVAGEFVSIDLFAVTLRDASETPEVVIPPHHDWLRMRLDTQGLGTYASFRAVLTRQDGSEIYEEGGLVYTNELPGVVLFTVPAAELESGGYSIDLWGQNPGQDPKVVAGFEMSVLASHSPSLPE